MMKKSVIAFLCAVFVLASNTVALAETTMQELAPIPVWLIAPAIGDSGQNSNGETVIGGVDFSITDKLPLVVHPGESILNLPEIKIINNSNTGQLSINQVKVETTNGWTLKPDKASYFENLKANTKELSIVADGSHDFATDGVYKLGESKLVSPKGGSNSVVFSGHVGTFTKKVNTIVANIIPTIEIY